MIFKNRKRLRLDAVAYNEKERKARKLYMADVAKRV